jgi:hypothetical protein
MLSHASARLNLIEDPDVSFSIIVFIVIIIEACSNYAKSRKVAGSKADKVI